MRTYIIPVSDTHLEVYKRQTRDRPAARTNGVALTGPTQGRLAPLARRAPHPFSACPGQPSAAIFEAAMTAWVRLSTPSLVRMAETWAFTVASETVSS